MTIRLGKALKGLKPVSTKTFNSVFRGEVLLDDGSIRLGFIKDLDSRQLANELVVATLAKRVGVAVPDAALVVVPNDVSTAFTHINHANGGGYVAFCSMDAGPFTVAQIVAAEGVSTALSALKKPPALGNLYGFDTWVANVDRHRNNIILSGGGDAFLIDHGHCFSGPSWASGDLNSSAVYTNRLSNWLTPELQDDEKSQAMADIEKLIASMATLDIDQILSDISAANLYGESDSEALVGFLEGRISHVSPLAAACLGKLV